MQSTASRVLAHPEARYCLVDYSCPENTGSWFEKQFPRDVAVGRAIVERVVDHGMFNKCRAHNAGAQRALRAGAEYLCFLDADTIVQPGFYEYLRKHVRRDKFLIAGQREDGSDVPSMTGLLVVHREAFERVGGFDEGFVGWGGEDIELRLRLFLLGGVGFDDVPLSLVRPIPHGNDLRTKFYAESSIAASNNANMQRIHQKLRTEWRGRMVRDLQDAERLWYRHSSGATNEYVDDYFDDRDDYFDEREEAEVPQRPAPVVRAPIPPTSSRRLAAAAARLRGYARESS